MDLHGRPVLYTMGLASQRSSSINSMVKIMTRLKNGKQTANTPKTPQAATGWSYTGTIFGTPHALPGFGVKFTWNAPYI